MKQEFEIPTAQDLEALLGAELYSLWLSLCSQIERYYSARLCGTAAAKNGIMNINIALALKRCVLYMPRKRH